MSHYKPSCFLQQIELQDINLFRILMAGMHDANLYQGEMLLHLVLTVYPSSGIAVYACSTVVKKSNESIELLSNLISNFLGVCSQRGLHTFSNALLPPPNQGRPYFVRFLEKIIALHSSDRLVCRHLQCLLSALLSIRVLYKMTDFRTEKFCNKAVCSLGKMYNKTYWCYMEALSLIQKEVHFTVNANTRITKHHAYSCVHVQV